jgi:O-glycosyl hydrolase
MPRKSRYNISEESLSVRCTRCQELIHPRDLLYVYGKRLRCPHCKGDFERVSKRSSASRRIILSISLLVFCLSGVAANSQPASVVLDGNSKGRVFDGLGAASAGASSRLLIDYPEPQRSQILDYLFKPGYGASLQHLKVEIGADVNSTDGSEPSPMRSPSDHDSTRGYEWWLMVEAHKRNPNIILEILPWGAPSWVGDNTLYTPKMAEYVADFIQTAKQDYSLDIAYAGAWNEMVFNIPYIKELHRRFQADHLTTRIVCCDEYAGQGPGQWSIADPMLKDPELAASIAVIGAHYPDWNLLSRIHAKLGRLERLRSCLYSVGFWEFEQVDPG